VFEIPKVANWASGFSSREDSDLEAWEFGPPVCYEGKEEKGFFLLNTSGAGKGFLRG